VYVIGTAGHVDHGKTLLIEALTGINADRLPEEKNRGLTVDLGFAHFQGNDGEPVGVIDVPGHERFIRNMVAGAWSLDLALLVIAADDGWMQQTHDHTKVLLGTGVENIIIVITKVDSVSEEQALLAEEDALENFEALAGFKVESVRVSALSGEGIDTIKNTILTALNTYRRKQSMPSTCLYVDRVFTLRGTGTVLTGSLTGGTMSVNQEITILPSKKKKKIRTIQSYHHFLETAHPVSRVALNLQNLKRDELSRGDCLVTEPDRFWCEKTFVIKVNAEGTQEHHDEYAANVQEPVLKDHTEVEVAYGTSHKLGKLHFLHDRRFARIMFTEEAAVYWLEPCILIRHGGSSIIGTGQFVWPGDIPQQERKHLSAALAATLPGEISESFASLELLYYGYAPADSTLTEDLQGLHVDTVVKGSWIVLKEKSTELIQQIRTAAEQFGGINQEELRQQIHVPADLLASLITNLINEGKLQENKDLLFSADQVKSEAKLSKNGRKILQEAQQAGKIGLELKKITIPGAQKEIRYLVRAGFLIPLEGNIYYTPETYRGLCDAILSGLEKGDHFSIPQAKEKVGLTRKYMLPLLNRMEHDGLVKRDNNERIVL
jgi:selenocysteine-specific elongation factor